MLRVIDTPFQYGGQAVIEGVMMRGPQAVAIAVRVEGKIVVNQENYTSWAGFFSFLKWPLIRGTVVLLESLILGVRALGLSASLVAGEEDGKTLGSFEIGLTVALALLLATVLFIFFPTWIGHLARTWMGVWGQNVVEGIVRLEIFLLYLFAISRFRDIQRIFQYHGAEHKVINAFEDGADLTVSEVAKCSPLHPSCGTSFLLVVLVVSILVFAFFGNGPWWWKFSSRLVLFPLVAGLGYELVRYARCYRQRLGLLITPGLWLQKMTTREPDFAQLEVAISALQAVLPPLRKATVSES